MSLARRRSTRPQGARAHAVVAVAVVIATIALSACDRVRVGEEVRGDFDDPTPGVEGLAVPLIIQEGPDGSTLAFVPVFINGQGPFRFALDTGASTSIVDRQLAGRLQLPEEGEATTGVGVGGPTEATPVGIESWRLGEVELEPRRLTAIELPDGQSGLEAEGLLGSDVLSAFGRVTIDYEGELLILRPADPTEQN